MLEQFLMALGLDYLTSDPQQWDPEAKRKSRALLMRYVIVIFACSLLFFLYLVFHG